MGIYGHEWTALRIMHLVDDLQDEIRKLRAELVVARKARTDARAALRAAHASAYVNAHGQPQDMRKQIAIAATVERSLAVDVAEDEVDRLTGEVFDLKDRVSVGQTLANTVRSEVGLVRLDPRP